MTYDHDPIDPATIEMSIRRTLRNMMWGHADTMRDAEIRLKGPYVGALGRLVNGIFREEADSSGSFFEVGTGAGFMPAVLHPDYLANLRISDLFPARLAPLRRSLGRNFPVEHAQAEALPLGDGSVDYVVAMDTYSAVEDLEVAMAQAERVLVPGGKFIHIQSNRPVEYIPWLHRPASLCVVDENDNHSQNRLLFFEPEDARKILALVPDHTMLLDLSKDPIQAFIDYRNAGMSGDNAQVVAAIIRLKELFTQLGIPYDEVDLMEYFTTRIHDYSLSAGLIVLRDEMKTVHYTGPKTDAHRAREVQEGRRLNFFRKFPNHKRTGFSEMVESSVPGGVFEDVTAHIFVAQKPE